MSTIDTSQRDWTSISEQNLDSKYEKCRNITEEIYKRINITFQIKKLEANQSELSDNSDLIDSNELSNGTDLFACDKSDLTSSSEAQKPTTDCGKFINNNNNEERGKLAAKRPKKRLRKRVKKRQLRARSSEGSSDEAPLSRIAEPAGISHTNIDTVLKQKLEKKTLKKEAIKKPPAKTQQKKSTPEKKNIDFTNKSLSVRIDKLPIPFISMKDDNTIKNYKSYMKDNKLTIKNETPKDDTYPSIDASRTDRLSMKTDKLSLKTDSMKEEKEARRNCTLCSMNFRGERGLRRHMSLSHILPEN